MSHENEEWCQIWKGLHLPIQDWYEGFDKFWPEHSTVSKIWTLMSYFWPKYIMFVIFVQRSYVWLHQRLMQNLKKNSLVLLKWHEEFGKFSPENVQKSKSWDFIGSVSCFFSQYSTWFGPNSAPKTTPNLLFFVCFPMKYIWGFH